MIRGAFGNIRLRNGSPSARRPATSATGEETHSVATWPVYALVLVLVLVLAAMLLCFPRCLTTAWP